MQVNFNLSINIDDRIISFFKRIFTIHKIYIVIMIALITVTLNASVPVTFTAGTTIIADDVNANFDALDTRITALEGYWSTDTSNGSGTVTSKILNDYEEGTWNPVMYGETSGSLSSGLSGTYIKIGRLVYARISRSAAIAASTLVGGIYITGLPYAASGHHSFMLPCLRAGSATFNPFGIMKTETTVIKLHDLEFGDISAYPSQPATFTGFTQNGTTSVIFNWTFIYETD